MKHKPDLKPLLLFLLQHRVYVLVSKLAYAKVESEHALTCR